MRKKGAIKRKASHKAESELHRSDPDEQNHKEEEDDDKGGNVDPMKAAGGNQPKRPKIAKPEEEEPQYFEDKRNLEDFWMEVFPVGTEWDQLDLVYQYKWNFSNLEDAFEEGGCLYNKKVYLFGCTEPQLVTFQGRAKVTMIPAVVAVVSPFPPSDKIGIKSVQRVDKNIEPMKKMKMYWVPYIPLEKRGSMVERLKNYQIFILRCTQRRAGLKHLTIERVKDFEYCLPYFYNPFQQEEQSKVVPIDYPIEPNLQVVGYFDWEFDELEEFTDTLIEEELPADHKEPFQEYIKKEVRAKKEAHMKEREAREKALAEMSEETKAAYENMTFYKFYPAPSPDTPDVSSVKVMYI